MSEPATRPGSTVRRLPSPAALPVGLAAVAYAWLAGRYPSFSWKAALAVLLPGIGTLGYGVATASRRPRTAVRPPTFRGALACSVPVLAFVAVEILNDKLGSTPEHRTLSVLSHLSASMVWTERS